MHARTSAALWAALCLSAGLLLTCQATPASAAIGSAVGKGTIRSVTPTPLGLRITGSGFGAAQGEVRCDPAANSSVVSWSDTKVETEWNGTPPTGKIKLYLVTAGKGPWSDRVIASMEYTIPTPSGPRISSITKTATGLKIAGSNFGTRGGDVACDPRAGLTVAGWRATEVVISWDGRPPTGKITITLTLSGKGPVSDRQAAARFDMGR